MHCPAIQLRTCTATNVWNWQVIRVWSSEIVGAARVLSAFRDFVEIRHNKRLYNEVCLLHVCKQLRVRLGGHVDNAPKMHA